MIVDADDEQSSDGMIVIGSSEGGFTVSDEEDPARTDEEYSDMSVEDVFISVMINIFKGHRPYIMLLRNNISSVMSSQIIFI